MPCPRRGIRGRVPTATGGPPYSRKGEGDHLSRLTEARLGSGLGQAPSPARAGAQDTGADSPTLRILAWVQTESGVHTSVQKEATRPVGSIPRSPTAPHGLHVPATAPTFGGAPGLASEGRSESSVSSRAQASSWERCMVPVGSRGADRRQRGHAGLASRAGGGRGAGWPDCGAGAGPSAARRRLGAL